jgi:orotate phosphoribosyltransferase
LQLICNTKRDILKQDDIAQHIAHQLLGVKAVKLSPQAPFTWASGIQSPIYCDNRKILSYPKARKIVVQAFVERAKTMGTFHIVAGVATAGIPWGALIADALELPFVYVRDKAKGHGLGNRIEGELRGNERILVIEDLISTGGSSIEAVNALENFGCTVVGVLAIFTYGFASAAARFAEAECNLVTLSNYDALVGEAIKIGYVEEEDLAILAAFRQGK